MDGRYRGHRSFSLYNASDDSTDCENSESSSGETDSSEEEAFLDRFLNKVKSYKILPYILRNKWVDTQTIIDELSYFKKKRRLTPLIRQYIAGFTTPEGTKSIRYSGLEEWLKSYTRRSQPNSAKKKESDQNRPKTVEELNRDRRREAYKKEFEHYYEMAEIQSFCRRFDEERKLEKQ